MVLNKTNHLLIYMQINNVDICCGLAWGDEAKGKIVSQLIKNKNMILYVVGVEEVMQVTLYILTA